MILALLLAAHSVPTLSLCAPLEETLPPAFAAWARPAPAGRRLIPGRAARVALVPFGASGIPLRPGYNDHPNTFGRRIGFDVASAGTYRIAFDSWGWIELARHGRRLDPVARSGGPQCSAIDQVFDFQLQPGHYELRINANKPDPVLMLIVPA